MGFLPGQSEKMVKPALLIRCAYQFIFAKYEIKSWRSLEELFVEIGVRQPRSATLKRCASVIFSASGYDGP